MGRRREEKNESVGLIGTSDVLSVVKRREDSREVRETLRAEKGPALATLRPLGGHL